MKLSQRSIGTALILCAIAFVTCFGIIGFGRGGERNVDGAYLYIAGKTWLSGLNPYMVDVFQSIGKAENLPSMTYFAYPPQSALLCIATAIMGYQASTAFILLLNVLSVGCIVTISSYFINGQSWKVRNWPLTALISAIAIGNPFTTHVFWMGQTSLIAFAAAMGSWFFYQRQHFMLAGLCLGFASFKPQVCLLLVIWFLLERSWKVLLTSLGTALFLSLPPLLLQGPIGMLTAWLGALEEYSSGEFNMMGFQHVVGLESLFHAAGIDLPSLKGLGIFLAVALWIFRRRFNPEDIFGILMGISVTFIYAHDYDYVFLIPIFTSLLLYSLKNLKVGGGLVVAGILMMVPQRFIRVLEIPVLNHWRTLVVLILLIELVILSVQYSSQNRASLLDKGLASKA